MAHKEVTMRLSLKTVQKVKELEKLTGAENKTQVVVNAISKLYDICKASDNGSGAGATVTITYADGTREII